MTSSDTIEAYHLAEDISVNDLSHNAWNQARPIPITQYWSGDPAPPSRHAEAQLVWSEAAFNVRFTYPQKEPLVVSSNPQTSSKTLGLWDRDVCEVFIAPDPNEPNSYFEFEAAPTGEWVDLAIRITATGRETDFAFHSGMTSAARIQGERIVVGIRIPWSERIPKPHPGDKWRVNLFRCVGSDPTRGYLAWHPTYTPEPSFHTPDVFGSLMFIE